MLHIFSIISLFSLVVTASPLDTNRRHAHPASSSLSGKPALVQALSPGAVRLDNSETTHHDTPTETIPVRVRTLTPGPWSPAVSDKLEITERAVEKRNETSPICNIPSYPTQMTITAAINAINLLKVRQGVYTIGAGPHHCDMMACGNGDDGDESEGGASAEIYWCNDNPNTVSLDYLTLAGYARDILFNCWGQGQAFDTDNFNVILAGKLGIDSC